MSIAQHLPLQLRLIASVAAALLITAGLSVVPIYWHAKSKVMTEMQAALAVGEQVAKDEMDVQNGAQNLSQRLEQMIAHLNGNRHLKAELRTASGAVIASSKLAPPTSSAPQWFQRFIKADPQSTTLTIERPGISSAQLVITADPTNEIGEAWEDLTTFAGILSLFCLLVLGSVSWIVTRAITPIRALLDAYAGIAQGDLKTRVTPSGSPELQQLCLGFNDMGDALQKMGERNARLARQLEDVQEEERADLARDLHDEVSPLLFAADVDATMIAKLAKDANQATIEQHTTAIRGALRQLKKTVTLILGRLRPGVLLDQGLSVAIENLVSTNEQRHPDIKFHVQFDELHASPIIESTIFFVVREAVANALRHANPKSISISGAIDGAEHICVVISDDGNGLIKGELQPGFGIRGMSERVSRLGGTFDIREVETGTGTRVEIRLPQSENQHLQIGDEAKNLTNDLPRSQRPHKNFEKMERSALRS